MGLLQAALALLPVALVGCTTTSAGVDGGGGTHDAGDAWTLAVRYTEGGTFRMTFAKTVVGVVERHGAPAYEIRVEPTFEEEQRPGKSVEHTWTEWVRVPDLAAIEMHRHHEGRIAPPATEGEAYDYSEDSTTLHVDPCPSLVGMQLEVGLEWTSTCRRSTSTVEWSSKRGSDWHNHTSEETTAYRVEAQEEVTVKAGTFLAYRVTATTEDSEATIWVVQDGCWTDPVKVEHAYENEEHAGQTRMELADVRC